MRNDSFGAQEGDTCVFYHRDIRAEYGDVFFMAYVRHKHNDVKIVNWCGAGDRPGKRRRVRAAKAENAAETRVATRAFDPFFIIHRATPHVPLLFADTWRRSRRAR